MSILVSTKVLLFYLWQKHVWTSIRSICYSLCLSQGCGESPSFSIMGLCLCYQMLSWNQDRSHFVVLSASVSNFFEELWDCVGMLCCQGMLSQWKNFAYFGTITDRGTCPLADPWIKFLNKSAVQTFNHLIHSISAALTLERKYYSSWDEWD